MTKRQISGVRPRRFHSELYSSFILFLYFFLLPRFYFRTRPALFRLFPILKLDNPSYVCVRISARFCFVGKCEFRCEKVESFRMETLRYVKRVCEKIMKSKYVDRFFFRLIDFPKA